jgi:hypothetical protein
VGGPARRLLFLAVQLPDTCPSRPNTARPRPRSRKAGIRHPAPAPTTPSQRRTSAATARVQAVAPGSLLRLARVRRAWRGRAPGLTSCRAQSTSSVQRPEQEPMVPAPASGPPPCRPHPALQPPPRLQSAQPSAPGPPQPCRPRPGPPPPGNSCSASLSTSPHCRPLGASRGRGRGRGTPS